MLQQKPDRIDRAFLMRYEEYRGFYGLQSGNSHALDNLDVSNVVSDTTPQEILAAAYQTIRRSLAEEILEAVKQCSPQFFERLVVELLVKMGYGGTREEAGQVVGGPGDGGIDGIIKEDRLGLEVIYVQAKRLNDASVGRPQVQQFVGALQGQRARKGVFITTAEFASTAVEFADSLDSKVILIGGRQLAEYMIEFGLGVETEAVYEMKRISLAYFDE